MNWDQAKVAADGLGAHLATIASASEMNRVYLITGPREHWLGGRQQPGSCEPSCGWYWITGENWGYANWAPGDPSNTGNQDTLKMYADGTWDDTCSCEFQRSLVEWDADCNGDGVVDKGQILLGELPDIDGNGVPDPCEVPTCTDADFFRDFNVNGADLGILLSQWGPNSTFTVSDLNRDGIVNGDDLGIFLSFWGPCP
jgi:hypothetical protein